MKAARSDPAAHNQMAAVAAALQCMMSPDVALPLDVFDDCCVAERQALLLARNCIKDLALQREMTLVSVISESFGGRDESVGLA